MKRRLGRDAHLVDLMSAISTIMTEQHVSQAELARRMNTDPSSVCKVLKLKVDPLASTLIAMLKALDCDLAMNKKSTDAPTDAIA